MPAAKVCVNLFLYPHTKSQQPISELGAITGENLVPLSLRGDNQNGGEQSRPTAWEQGDRVAIW